jgi:hypothetical protein
MYNVSALIVPNERLGRIRLSAADMVACELNVEFLSLVPDTAAGKDLYLTLIYLARGHRLHLAVCLYRLKVR